MLFHVFLCDDVVTLTICPFYIIHYIVLFLWLRYLTQEQRCVAVCSSECGRNDGCVAVEPFDMLCFWVCSIVFVALLSCESLCSDSSERGWTGLWTVLGSILLFFYLMSDSPKLLQLRLNGLQSRFYCSSSVSDRMTSTTVFISCGRLSATQLISTLADC